MKIAAVVAVLSLCRVGLSWDAAGHRAITWLALDRLPADGPGFLREEVNRDAVAWNSAEPDRWRGERNPFVINSTYMDHFIDVEDLSAVGMTLETVPMLRYRFVRDCTLARAKWPAGPDGNTKPYDEKRDQMGQAEFPGFVGHAICEQQARLTNQFRTWRILTTLNDPARASHLKMAEANIMSTMGVLSHFVGDTAQPLHTTKHYNGWAEGSENPQGYTADRRFHAYIDGGVIRDFALDYRACRAVGGNGTAPELTGVTAATPDPKNPSSAWAFTVSYIKRSHEKVLPLYAMEKDGTLKQEAGKRFIIDCLNDGGATLAAYYNAAWVASRPSEKEIEDFKKYDGFDPAQSPGAGAVQLPAAEPVKQAAEPVKHPAQPMKP